MAGALLACAVMAIVPAAGNCLPPSLAHDPAAGEATTGSEPAPAEFDADNPIGAEVGEAGSDEIVCVGDSCQSLPAEPEDPTPATLVPNAGNPPLRFFEPKKHEKKRRKHHGGRRGGPRRAERTTR